MRNTTFLALMGTIHKIKWKKIAYYIILNPDFKDLKLFNIVVSVVFLNKFPYLHITYISK